MGEILRFSYYSLQGNWFQRSTELMTEVKTMQIKRQLQKQRSNNAVTASDGTKSTLQQHNARTGTVSGTTKNTGKDRKTKKEKSPRS